LIVKKKLKKTKVIVCVNPIWTSLNNHSNGQLGFSVQKKIYQSLGGTKKYDDKVWQSLCDTVGWRKDGKWLYYTNISFDKTATKQDLKAHLPVAFGYEGGGFS
jgi:serine/threonine-protein kinase